MSRSNRRETPEQRVRPGRIGPWRLLDLVYAVAPWRTSMLGSAGAFPEYGPPDSPVAVREPYEELPGSNIGEGERRYAMEREIARRFITARRVER